MDSVVGINDHSFYYFILQPSFNKPRGKIIFLELILIVIIIFIIFDIYKQIELNRIKIKLFDKKYKIAERIKKLGYD